MQKACGFATVPASTEESQDLRAVYRVQRPERFGYMNQSQWMGGSIMLASINLHGSNKAAFRAIAERGQNTSTEPTDLGVSVLRISVQYLSKIPWYLFPLGRDERPVTKESSLAEPH